MFFQIGSQKLRFGSTEVQISRKTLRSGADTPYGEQIDWRIKHWIVSQVKGTSAAVADIKAQTAAVEAILMQENQSLRLVGPDGTTDTHHVIDNSQTEGGVSIIQRPTYQDAKGAQGVTHRTLTMAYRAVIYDDPASLEYGDRLVMTEQMQWEPGGSLDGHITTLRGPAVKQRRYAMQPDKVRQVGSATGLRDYPTPALPRWPASRTHQKPRIIKHPVIPKGDSYSIYRISWTWEFEDAYVLAGRPHILGIDY